MAKREDGNNSKDHLLKMINNIIKKLQVDDCHEITCTSSKWNTVAELCLWLDHAFSHGLCEAQNGYWPFVKEITHKTVLKQILSSPSLITNSKKGIMWLLLAVNDFALESYVRVITSDGRLLNKYYQPSSLFRDEQRLQLLIAMSAGLEHIDCSLNLGDTDLVNKIINTIEHYEVCVDTSDASSICSSKSDTSVPISCDSYFGDRESPVIDSYESSNVDPRILKILNMDTESSIENDSEDFIIHSSTHVKKKQKNSKRSEFILQNICSNSLEKNVGEEAANEGSTITNKSTIETLNNEENSASVLKTIGSLDANILEDSEKNSYICENSTHKESEIINCINPDKPDLTDYVDKSNIILNKLIKNISMNEIGRTEEECKQINSEPKMDSLYDEHLVEVEESVQLLEREAPEGQEDPSMFASQVSVQKQQDNNGTPNNKVIVELDDKTSTNHKPLNNKRLNTPIMQIPVPKPSSVNLSTLTVTSKTEENCIREEIVEGRKDSKLLLDGEVSVDNNFLLFLMLEIFGGQEEKFYKMFYATMGHTLGESLLTFLVLTDKNLYVLQSGNSKKIFYIYSTVSYHEIDFVQLSFNYQIINLVTISPRRRLWFCTGDESITKNIVASLELAMRRCPKPCPPCVLTDPITQRITLQKWASRELKCEASKVEILHYAVVYWEDLQKIRHFNNNPIGPKKDGFLMYQYTGNAFLNPVWKPGYFVLKSGVLYLFNDSVDKQMLSHIQLQNGECIGCRRVHVTDRPHVFEILLKSSEKFALQLAAPDEFEVSDWLSAFLQSASRQLESPNYSTCSVSCSLVLTNQKLFVCQENLETGTIHSLCSVNISNIANISSSSEEDTFCILELESAEAMESMGDWVLYFSSRSEVLKFLKSISSVWESTFKVPINITKLDSREVEERCQYASFLTDTSRRADNFIRSRSSWKFSY